ncbi:MAG TPA: type II secretion system F family protein [Candidatus Ratteibacteria bacterium]|nr:type II secretion system F family protein [Candidatus Ratteibacteria bacterium]
MENFQYIALDKKGKTISGQIEGNDIDDIKSHLKEKGLYVIKVEKLKEKFPFLKKISEEELIISIRELATFINSGLQIDEALTGLISQMKEGNLKNIYKEIQKNIREGQSLSMSLKKYPFIFSDTIISMVKAGEETGTLDIVLTKISEFLEKNHRFKTKIMSIMSYPILMLSVASVVVIFILSFVIPTITKVFSQISMELPIMTSILINISSFLKKWWYFVFAGIALTLWGINVFLKTSRGIKFSDNLKLKTPFFKDIYIKKEIVNFSRTIATLIKGGVDIVDGLVISRNVLTSPSIKNELNNIIELVTKGGTLSNAFSNSSYFPYLVTQLVNAGEKSGNLSEMFDKIADIYEEEINQKSTKFVNLLEPGMIVFMGIIVGFIVLAVLLPIFQISQSIK